MYKMKKYYLQMHKHTKTTTASISVWNKSHPAQEISVTQAYGDQERT